MDISNHYKSELERIRAKFEDINTPDEEVKQLQGQYENLGIINSTVQTLVDIDNDNKLYNIKASTLHERFVEQGTTVEEFRKAYNNGRALPKVKTIDGISVGGMEFIDSSSDTKFIDLQYKINENTIKSSVEIRTDDNLNTATTAFGTNHKSFTDTDKYNTDSSTVQRSVLAGQYVEGAIGDANNAAIEFINANPGFEAGLFQQASADDSMFSAEDQNFLEAYGSVYNASNNRPSYKALHKAAVEKIIIDRGLTKDDVNKKVDSINTLATKTIEDKKNNIILQFVENENLKKLKGDFFVQNKDEVIDTNNLSTTEQEYYTNIFGAEAVATGSVTLKSNKAYPKKALYQSVQNPKEKADDSSSRGSGSVVGIVEDLNTQFNAITSDAEIEFSKPGYAAGTTRGGEGQAPQMFNFLTNKSYMKGGSEKSIDNVEYRIIGEGEDRKVLLDIFSTSSGKEDKLATVDLGDTIARRDFLTNIGQGLAVTSKEKQTVRDETTMLTQSREKAFDVFKDISVGDKNSSRWNVLAKAVRNNSSEGLNAEERKAFLKAGYGRT
jgi:hypothetical protein